MCVILTPATSAFEVGPSFLWYEGCREHRGWGSSKLWKNQKPSDGVGVFKIPIFSTGLCHERWKLKQRAEPSFKSHPVESSESFVSEPSVFSGTDLTFSIKKPVAQERSFSCFSQILSPKSPVVLTLTFAPQGSDILYSVLRVPAAWGSDCCLSERYCTVLIAYARRKARKMHILRVLQNFAGVTLLSEWFGQINLWRHQRHWASQYNLIMRSDFHDSFWTLSFSLSIEGRHSGWSGFRSPEKCFLFTFFDTVSKPDSPASFLPTMIDCCMAFYDCLCMFLTLHKSHVLIFFHALLIQLQYLPVSLSFHLVIMSSIVEQRFWRSGTCNPFFFPDYTMHWN